MACSVLIQSVSPWHMFSQMGLLEDAPNVEQFNRVRLIPESGLQDIGRFWQTPGALLNRRSGIVESVGMIDERQSETKRLKHWIASNPWARPAAGEDDR
jgi:hypothetical protein